MFHSWFAYLPPHLAHDLLAHPEMSPLSRIHRSHAVALFADISGFTSMSEALGRQGPAGTEELSQILNQTFGFMIRIIHSYGGSIGTFAGDALTVLFMPSSHNRRATARRAMQCALDMQTTLMALPTITTSAGDFHLTMKIGLADGQVYSTTVGDPNIRLTYLLTGSAIDRCSQAEHYAAPGTVVITADLVPLAGAADHVVIVDGFHQLQRLHRSAQPALIAPLPPPSDTVDSMFARYLPAVIAHRLAHGMQGFVAEHRTVTTVFVRFRHTAAEATADLSLVQNYLRQVVQILERYDGHLRQVDLGDKGSLFIALFGAPTTHEDDPDRALLAALDIRALGNLHGIQSATGITTGHIYCGLVGSDDRAEYAAIGDAVNLAARLMSAAAWSQILVDTNTRQRTATTFVWQELPPISVKGKLTRIAIAALERRQRRTSTRLNAPGYTLPMVGRQRERDYCCQVLAQIRQGHGQIIGITGEAGMGKSRLVAEVMRTAAREGLAYFASECLSYGIHTSYLVWQNLLRGLFDLPTSLAPDQQVERLRAALTQIDPQLHDHLPLFGPIFNLDIPENDLIHGLTPQQRKEALEDLVVRCLSFWSRAQPLLLVFDDCHWIDPLSDELLLATGQRCTDLPLLILITYRSVDGEYRRSTGEFLRIRTLLHYYELHLHEFDQAETTELIRIKLASSFGLHTEVPAPLRDRIIERAQGNPFYIDELLNFLHDRGINPKNAAALTQVELPDTLQRLILSRIDRLEEEPKITLKLASIIGRLFKADWLWRVYSQLGDAQHITGYLQKIQQLDLAQMQRSDPETEYLFKHMLTREVAYESLALSTRMLLHEQVGAFIEQHYQHDLQSWLDALAYHYGQSGNTAKQREYFQRAGDAAQDSYANESAIAYYMRLLPLLPPAEQIPILLLLSELQERIGQYEQSADAASTALAQAEPLSDLHLLARCWQRIGLLAIETNHFDQAMAQLGRALDAFQRTDNQQAACKILGRIGHIYFMQGRYAELLTLSEQHLALATAIDDQREICQALINIGGIHNDQGRYQEALEVYERGGRIALEANLLREQYLMRVRAGIVHHFLGNYDQAFVNYLAAVQNVIRMGFRGGISLCLANLGRAYGMNGQFHEATACLHWCVRYGLEQGDRRALAWTIGHLGSQASERGEFPVARRLLDTSLALYRTLEAPVMQAAYLQQRAQVAYVLGELAVAQIDIDETLRIARQHDLLKERLQAQVLHLRLRLAQQQCSVADALMELERLEQQQLPLQEQALVVYTLWQLAPHESRYRVRAAERYRALYEQGPNSKDGRRYTELTGELLPPLALLPPPPVIVRGALLDLDLMLGRVADLLAAYTQAAP